MEYRRLLSRFNSYAEKVVTALAFGCHRSKASRFQRILQGLRDEAAVMCHEGKFLNLSVIAIEQMKSGHIRLWQVVIRQNVVGWLYAFKIWHQDDCYSTWFQD